MKNPLEISESSEGPKWFCFGVFVMHEKSFKKKKIKS